MTAKSERFVKENDKSPVTIGSAIGKGGEGGRYRLENGKLFVLNLEDCLDLPEGYPKWLGQ